MPPTNANSPRIFKEWADEDFYGPNANHVYLYSIIEPESVQRFRTDLQKAYTKNKHKPIVVHLHSPGGDASLGIALVNMVQEVPTPVAIVVDGYACSAVTPMLVSAPYRVMHSFSFVLLHEISWSTESHQPMRHVELKYLEDTIVSTFKEYQRIYQANTRIPQKDLKELLLRDIFLDAHTSKKYGMVDRVINFSPRTSNSRWNAFMSSYVPKKTQTGQAAANNLFVYQSTNRNNTNTKPVHTQRAESVLRIIQPLIQHNAKATMPVTLYTNTYFAPRTRWFDMAAVMAHIYTMKVPVISVIDTEIDLLQAIPAIMSHKRYMYDNAYLTISLLYDHQTTGSKYYHDIKYNTELLRATLRKLLKQYTRMPATILNTLFDNRIILSPKQCKMYGIVDEIIPFKPRKPMTGGCGCSQGLAYTDAFIPP